MRLQRRVRSRAAAEPGRSSPHFDFPIREMAHGRQRKDAHLAEVKYTASTKNGFFVLAAASTERIPSQLKLASVNPTEASNSMVNVSRDTFGWRHVSARGSNGVWHAVGRQPLRWFNGRLPSQWPLCASSVNPRLCSSVRIGSAQAA